MQRRQVVSGCPDAVDTSRQEEIEKPLPSSRSTGSYDSGVGLASEYGSPSRSYSLRRPREFRQSEESPGTDAFSSKGSCGGSGGLINLHRRSKSAVDRHVLDPHILSNQLLSLSARNTDAVASGQLPGYKTKPNREPGASPPLPLHHSPPPQPEYPAPPPYTEDGQSRPPDHGQRDRLDLLARQDSCSTQASTVSTRGSSRCPDLSDDDNTSVSDGENHLTPVNTTTAATMIERCTQSASNSDVDSEPASDCDSIRANPPSPLHGTTPSEIWNNHLLPRLLEDFDKILGAQNPGCIDLLQHGQEVPVICITAAKPDTINCSLLRRELSKFSMKFHIEKRSGPDMISRTVGRSAAPQAPRVHLRKKWRWPAANPTYEETPSCGASIGIGRTSDVATFGGFIQLKYQSCPKEVWDTFGLTCHHILEDRAADTVPGRGAQEYRFCGREYVVTQPAIQHIKEEYERLDRHAQSLRAASAGKYQIALVDEQLENLGAMKPSFGKIFHSSGYGKMRDSHQMDWALIGDIPANRRTEPNLNTLPTGNVSNLLHPTGAKATSVAPQGYFQSIAELYMGQACLHRTPPEPICRVHGRGAISSNQSGYISGTQSIVKLGPYDTPSREHSFAPYSSLGTCGDSGAWLFDDFGTAVGMIIARNECTSLTYFTPMHTILEDIQLQTCAIGVRIAQRDPPPLLRRREPSTPATDRRDSGIEMSSGRSSCVSSIRGSIHPINEVWERVQTQQTISRMSSSSSSEKLLQATRKRPR